MEDKIKKKLIQAFNPLELVIVNQSHHHANHAAMKDWAGNSPGNTHFKVQVVSEKFQNMTKIERHKWVYQVLKEELKGDIHALSISTFTPQEAQNKTRE